MRKERIEEWSTRLDPDPSLILSVVMAASLAVTWGDRAPRPNARHHGVLSQALQFCCILIVLYGSVSLYRLNYFLAVAFVAITLHQLLAGEMSPEELEERRKALEKKGWLLSCPVYS